MKNTRQHPSRHGQTALKRLLAADPQTLGQMRPLLHEETARRMVGELNKSLFRAPLEEIERALKASW